MRVVDFSLTTMLYDVFQKKAEELGSSPPSHDLPSEDELISSIKQLEHGLTRKEKLIATLICTRTCYGVMNGFQEWQRELVQNEDKELIGYSEAERDSIIFDTAIEQFGFVEKVRGELASYSIPVNAKEQKTTDKWLPYQVEYDALVAEGMKLSVALHKIGNKIEAAIKESPANTPFKNRPDISTIRRQLVTNRK